MKRHLRPPEDVVDLVAWFYETTHPRERAGSVFILSQAQTDRFVERDGSVWGIPVEILGFTDDRTPGLDALNTIEPLGVAT